LSHVALPVRFLTTGQQERRGRRSRWQPSPGCSRTPRRVRALGRGSNPDGALSVRIRYAAQRRAGVVRPGSVGAARRSAGALHRVRDAGWPPGAGRPKQHDPALAECDFRRFPPFLRFHRRGRAAIAAAPSPERCRRHRSRRHHRIHRHYPLAEGRSANRLVVPSAPLSEKPCRRRGRTGRRRLRELEVPARRAYSVSQCARLRARRLLDDGRSTTARMACAIRAAMLHKHFHAAREIRHEMRRLVYRTSS